MGSSNYKRDYYRCTVAGCEAKRYCERMDAATVMVWYPGEVHNHSPPSSDIKTKRAATTGGVVKRPKRPKGMSNNGMAPCIFVSQRPQRSGAVSEGSPAASARLWRACLAPQEPLPC